MTFVLLVSAGAVVARCVGHSRARQDVLWWLMPARVAKMGGNWVATQGLDRAEELDDRDRLTRYYVKNIRSGVTDQWSELHALEALARNSDRIRAGALGPRRTGFQTQTPRDGQRSAAH